MSAARKPLLPLLAAAALFVAGLACNTLAPPRPAVAWDPDPNALIVSGTFCCGLVPYHIVENYVPAVQIWGDGRIVWVDQNNAGSRRVLTATLTPAQLTALVQQFVDAGFFGWDANYGDYSITDGATQCLSVALTSITKQVCEYYSGAPAAFQDLYATATGGAGAAGVDVAPVQGYVIAYPQVFQTPPTAETYLNWPAASLGVSLADNAGGQWLEGEALVFAWRVVNSDNWQPLVREGDAYYLLSVLVPGVTQTDPPTPPPDAP